LKNIICFFISLLPLNFLRIIFYNFFLKYNINHDCKIGFLVILNCEGLIIQNSKISNFNFFKGKYFKSKNTCIKNFNFFKNFEELNFINSKIGKRNKIDGPDNNTLGSLILKENTEIQNYNFFDITSSINIGNDCKIDSFCQFWSHGFDSDRKIKIGNISLENDVKIESSVMINYNVKIKKNTTIKLGSVVSKSLETSGIFGPEQIFRND